MRQEKGGEGRDVLVSPYHGRRAASVVYGRERYLRSETERERLRKC